MQHLLRTRRSGLIALLLALLVAGGCKTGENPVTGNRRVMGYSWEQEKKLGAQAHQQIEAQYGFYDEGNLQRYVERIGERVLAESDMRGPDTAQRFRETEFTFRVLDSPTVNAFALPGGYVYVSRGLVSHLNNEAQLALVLGHEIAHVAARHASQRAGEQQLAQIGLLGGAILGQEALGLPARSLLQLGSTATQLLFLKYSRGDEEESDELGVKYAARAGYAAGEGSAFFRSLERIQEEEGQGLPTWLSTHPDPGNRQQRIQELAQQWAQKTQMNTVDQEQYLETINGMVIGQNPRQGFVRNRSFYHPGGAFRFPVPSNFQVQNMASAVIMVSQEQDAVLQFSYAQGESPRAAARKFANQEGLRVRDDGSASSNGLPAYYVVADAQTQEQQQVRLLAYFVEKDNTVYQFLGYTTPQRFGSYRDVFLRSMRGFDELTDRNILNLQPTRLNIETASRSAAFRTFVEGEEGLAELGPQDMAIMNQVELGEQISAGRPLKLKSN